MVQVLNHASEQSVFAHDNGHVRYRFREPRSSGVWNDKNVHDTIITGTYDRCSHEKCNKQYWGKSRFWAVNGIRREATLIS